VDPELLAQMSRIGAVKSASYIGANLRSSRSRNCLVENGCNFSIRHASAAATSPNFRKVQWRSAMQSNLARLPVQPGLAGVLLYYVE
jgi:hypothetical protein